MECGRKKVRYMKGKESMEEINKIMSVREKQLEKIRQKKMSQISVFPEGRLEISYHHKNKVQYYRKLSTMDRGTYIKVKDKDLAIKLAQKDYDQKVLKSIDKELQAIKKFKSSFPKITAEHVYEKLHRERQKLVDPITLPTDAFLKQWEEFVYEGKGFDDNMPELYTDKNERVRSKSEVIIADSLYKANIPYRYECPLELINGLVIYPDFTLLNTKTRENVYWEHLGMMDDGNYAEKAIQKINTYMQNGIYLGKNLLVTFETRNNPINHRTIDVIINEYLN